MIKKLYWSLCKVLSHFNESGNFSEGFRKIIKNIKFHENQSIGSSCFMRSNRCDHVTSRLSLICENPKTVGLRIYDFAVI